MATAFTLGPINDNPATRLTNQLTQLQIDDILNNRQTDAYRQSPEYLNQQRATTVGDARTKWDTSRNTAYQTARKQIQDSFIDVGDPNGAAPYLAALESDYNNLKFNPGEDYHYDQPAQKGWNEQAYLAANPDIVASITGPGGPGFASGLDHYNRVGQAEGRNGLFDVAGSNHVVGGGDPTYDDPNSLLNKDYGVIGALTGIRQGRKDTAYGQAQGTVESYLKGLGLNDTDYGLLSSKVGSKLKNIYDTSGVSSNDYSSVFDPNTILDSTIGSERNLRRGQYTTQAKATFGGIDPNMDFADTADDSYINDIVGSQYNDTFNALDRAYKRGALTDTGYNAGLGELGRAKTSAIDIGNTLGGAVLNRDRSTLSGIKDKAVTDAGAWDFGQSYDPTSYKTQYDTKKASLASGLGGEVATALAGQNFFDVGSILNKAGFAQGAQNTAALTGDASTPVGLASLDEKKKSASATRGLGGAGVF